MDNTMLPAENKHKIITTIIIVLALITLLIFITYNIQKNKKMNQAPVKTETEQSADGLPKVFYSYIGTIQKVDNGTITIMAAKDKNYLTMDTVINVKTDGETVFISQDKNFDINKIEPGQSGEFYKTTNISFGDLKEGQEITAIDYENVRGKVEFTAKRIEVNAN
ncbi:MAG TPA: hypothetical protein PLR18_02735 [bacterium]|nr:hypothetical protein [bacterium]